MNSYINVDASLVHHQCSQHIWILTADYCAVLHARSNVQLMIVANGRCQAQQNTKHDSKLLIVEAFEPHYIEHDSLLPLLLALQ